MNLLLVCFVLCGGPSVPLALFVVAVCLWSPACRPIVSSIVVPHCVDICRVHPFPTAIPVCIDCVLVAASRSIPCTFAAVHGAVLVTHEDRVAIVETIVEPALAPPTVHN